MPESGVRSALPGPGARKPGAAPAARWRDQKLVRLAPVPGSMAWKLCQSAGLPEPLYRVTSGYGYTGYVRSMVSPA